MRRLIAAAGVVGALCTPTSGATTSYWVALETSTQGVTVVRADPLSLTTAGRAIVLGEYHYSSAVSPSRSRIAFGISAPGVRGRVGVRVIDVRRWKVVANITTGSAAEVLWWPSIRRLVAVSQFGSVVVANPDTGHVARTVNLPGLPTVDAVDTAVTTGRGLLVLLHGSFTLQPTHPVLALIGPGGSTRTALLDGILLANPSGADAVLVASSDRAFVVGSGVVGEIDLRTLHVTYHQVPALAATDVRRAARLGTVLAATGFGSPAQPVGLDLVDTTTWRVAHVEDQAAALAVSGDLVIAYSSGLLGVRAYKPDGSRAYTLLPDQVIRTLVATKTTLYVSTEQSTFVVDAATGTIARTITPARPLVAAIDMGG